MATLSTAMAILMCDTLVNFIDTGAGVGNLKFRASTTSAIATLPFLSTAFGDAAYNASADAARATMTAGDPSDTAVLTTTVTDAIIETVGGTDIFSDLICTITGGDITMTSKSISTGDTVTLTTLTVTMPRS